MKRRLIIVVALIAGAGLAAGLAPSPSPSVPGSATAASTYRIDSTHSTIVFRIRHMNLAPFYGRFNRMEGTIEWNSENPESSSFAITIPTESVSTANESRDNHLRSPDFFNAREFPEINFASTTVTPKGKSRYEVEGDLTMHGVTKPITIQLTRTGTGTHPRSGKDLIGFEATFAVQRTKFDMSYGVEQGVLGDEVTLMLGIEAAQE